MKMKKTAAILMAVVMLAGCTKTPVKSQSNTTQTETSVSKNQTPEVTDETPVIDASELWHKYDRDPDKKTPTYDGAEETVTGVITYIGKDDHGTDSMEIADKKDGTSYVIGVFGSADEMSSVSVGDTVTITGNFHIMSSTDKVVLKQCQIQKVYK